MQVSEKAANEWAHENKIDNFQVEQLFDPKTNLEAAPGICVAPLNTGNVKSDPAPFALAEYNAGASRAATMERRKRRR